MVSPPDEDNKASNRLTDASLGTRIEECVCNNLGWETYYPRWGIGYRGIAYIF